VRMAVLYLLLGSGIDKVLGPEVAAGAADPADRLLRLEPEGVS